MTRRAFVGQAPTTIGAAFGTARSDAIRRRVFAPADGTYAQSHEVAGAARWLFISGQVPVTDAGTVPTGFRAQCLAAWHNVRQRLTEAGMGDEHLVKVTVYLADRRYRDEARAVRQQVLGTLAFPPALTVVIVDIFDADWLVEIEAVAAA
jgi:2-iminobutanoate/2-iminopropanoate deaminase